MAEYSGEVFGNPMVCIGLVTFLGSIAAFFMKETLDVQTDDEIAEEKEDDGQPT